MKKTIKIFSLLLAFAMMFSTFEAAATAYAAAKSPSTVYSAIKNAYGKKFPLTKSAKTLGASELAVSKKYYSKCYGKQQGSSNQKYMVFIAYANSSSDAKKIKSQLKEYLEYENNSMGNYMSAQGKKLFKNAKVGVNGKYVYLVMLDTSSNKTAVNAIKKAV